MVTEHKFDVSIKIKENPWTDHNNMEINIGKVQTKLFLPMITKKIYKIDYIKYKVIETTNIKLTDNMSNKYLQNQIIDV